MEKSTPIGIGVGLVLIYGAIFMGTGWATFFDVASLVLVLGGTVAAQIVTFTFDEIKDSIKGVKEFFAFQMPDFNGFITMYSDLSRTARREGLLALDRMLGEIEDDFVRFGMEMAVDGVDAADINDMMNKRIAEEMSKRQLASKFLINAAAYAPAFGMIGTLIGLIQMLQNLTDPSQIGAGMAVALITTFYGALFANLLFIPMSTKAKAQLAYILKAREMVKAGTMGIVQGESPSMLEKRLRILAGEDGSGGGEAEAMKKAA